VKLSSLVQGYWRANDWQFTDQQLNRFIEQHVALGITSVDHAHVYGDPDVESLFGRALSLSPGLRSELEVVTKCGIVLDRGSVATPHYNQSYDAIIESTNLSLKRLGIEQIDLMLLHRPCFLMAADEVAKAFDHLIESGKVRRFGVSNFSAPMFELLQSRVSQPLSTNQVEISPLATQHLEDGVLDQAQRLGIRPMAWSCLAGGRIFNEPQTLAAVKKVAHEMGAQSPEQVIYAWVLKLPSKPLPIIGTGKIDRVKQIASSLELEMTHEQWYEIWCAAKGHGVP